MKKSYNHTREIKKVSFNKEKDAKRIKFCKSVEFSTWVKKQIDIAIEKQEREDMKK